MANSMSEASSLLEYDTVTTKAASDILNTYRAFEQQGLLTQRQCNITENLHLQQHHHWEPGNVQDQFLPVHFQHTHAGKVVYWSKYAHSIAHNNNAVITFWHYFRCIFWKLAVLQVWHTVHALMSWHITGRNTTSQHHTKYLTLTRHQSQLNPRDLWLVHSHFT